MWDQATQSLRDSMVRAITKIATLLPGLLAFVLAVILFTADGVPGEAVADRDQV